MRHERLPVEYDHRFTFTETECRELIIELREITGDYVYDPPRTVGKFLEVLGRRNT